MMLTLNHDDHVEALQTFKKSCKEIAARNPELPFSNNMAAGKNAEWQRICKAAMLLQEPDQDMARDFFETWFEPYAVTDNRDPQGLFTGYYLPVLKGSLKKNKQYTVPIYGVPSDLVKIDLGRFVPHLSEKVIVGQVKNHALNVYPKRSAIHNGAIKHSAEVLVWVNDAIDSFFAHIQGSALVQFADGKQQLLGYAGNNGHRYTSIGKLLIENNSLTEDNVSMQTIRTWLLAHPDQMHKILNKNESYVFFRFLENTDPIGAEQVPLTPRRTLAVDTRFVPLGAPVWLDTVHPESTSSEIKSFNHLMVAQDTGGSIKGIVRADIYWGPGEEAAFIAGHMRSTGKYWILLPRA
jgi:membrane-bound lytic murein transglycosylase A